MTSRKLKMVLVLATISFMTSAQKPMIYIKAVGGMYDMGELKKYQELDANYYTTNGQPAKVTFNFPFSVQAEAGADFEAKRLTFGPWVNLTQAKGELVYNNNSSTERITNKLSRLSVGFKVLKNVYKDFGVYGKAGVNASRLDSYKKYSCNGGAFELGVQWKYAYHHIRLITTVGYDAGVNGRLRNFDSYDDDLKNTKGEYVKVNWNGLRFGIGIGFSFGRNPNSKRSKSLPFIPKTIKID